MINDLYYIQKMQPPAHTVYDVGNINPSIVLTRTSELSEITLPLHFGVLNIRVYDHKYKAAYEGVGYIRTPPLPLGTENLKKYIYHNSLRMGLKILFIKIYGYDSSEYIYQIRLVGFVEEQDCRCPACNCNVYLNLATNEVECLNLTCSIK